VEHRLSADDESVQYCPMFHVELWRSSDKDVW